MTTKKMLEKNIPMDVIFEDNVFTEEEVELFREGLEDAQFFVDSMAYMPYNNHKGENMIEFEVVFYEKENGDCPVEDFLATLDTKMRAKMVGLLELLEEKGNGLREPYSKAIDDGIFEIRCKSWNRYHKGIVFLLF